MTKNIGKDWKEIRDSKKGNNQRREKQKQLQKKKKLRKKNQELESRQKKITMKQAIWSTNIMSYRKFPWDEET